MVRIKIIALICGFLLLSNCGGSAATTLLRMHLLTVDGATNFRDFGGYMTVSRKLVRWHKLYRSSNLSELTDTGLVTYEGLGIRAIIDLRSVSEIESAPDRYPSGVVYHNIALVDNLGAALLVALETGKTSGLEFDKIVQAYADFYTSNVDNYKEILPIVMSSDSRPIDIHCTQGAVRTGFTVALIQLVLDVTMNSVVDDFLLTNEALGSEIDKTIETFRQMIIDNTGQDPTAQDMENLANFATMHEEYLESALNGVIVEYGSLDVFIKDGLGITDYQRSAFQEALLQ